MYWYLALSTELGVLMATVASPVEVLDGWSKLTAVGVMGVLLAGTIYALIRQQKQNAESRDKLAEGFQDSVRSLGESHQESCEAIAEEIKSGQNRLIELLSKKQ